MRKELREIRSEIKDYDIRLWGDDIIITGKGIFCCLDMFEDELIGFGLQTNFDDNKEEKVLKLCLDVRNALKELDDYLEERWYETK